MGGDNENQGNGTGLSRPIKTLIAPVLKTYTKKPTEFFGVITSNEIKELKSITGPILIFFNTDAELQSCISQLSTISGNIFALVIQSPTDSEKSALIRAFAVDQNYNIPTNIITFINNTKSSLLANLYKIEVYPGATTHRVKLITTIRPSIYNLNNPKYTK